ncbi:serine palmitoyltransferase small subunit A-like [Branchiostoma floridae x Branchiostoma japonicum]|uniref:Serine palmitoyltransferase small subunit A n=1 Tax=Branchiostoma floridae TaxID=7739 RepID=C3Y0C0_BRAFL|eukprot:XP_002610183.1 hypothetical protein BRAFLDRAFT_264227 [Branchiostoma floridae]
MALFQVVRDWVQLWYYRYLLVTALYMLQPWERHLFHSCLAVVLAMSVYSTSVFFPKYIASILDYYGYYDGDI